MSFTTKDVSCKAGTDGNIILEPEGGVEPYSYLWSDGTITKDISNLSAGQYTIEVTDVNNCSKSELIAVSEPDKLTATINSPVYDSGHNISEFDENDGSINLEVEGGVPSYTFVWSTGDNSEDLDDLTAGSYSVNIIDQNGCTTKANIILTEPNTLEMPTGYTPNRDGRNDYFHVRGLEAYPDNTITVYNRWGNVVFRKIDYRNDWNGENSDGSELPDATYFVVLRIFGTDGSNLELTGYVDLRR